MDFKTFKPISDFPQINSDISFLIKNENKINAVNEWFINSMESKILKEQFIFDFYKDDKR